MSALRQISIGIITFLQKKASCPAKETGQPG
jgi:hypothetical protein